MLNTTKMKYLLSGIIIGATISVSAMAFAKAPIRIVFNNKPLENANAIMINDHVYLPVRAISEALGIKVDWDESNQQVILQSKNSDEAKNALTSPPKPTQSDQAQTQQTYKQNQQTSDIIETKFNGMRAVLINNKTYFSITDWTSNLKKNGKEINVEFDINDFFIDINNVKKTISKKDSIIYNETVYIDSKYYN